MGYARLFALFLVGCSSAEVAAAAPAPPAPPAADDAGMEAGPTPSGKPTSLLATMGGVARPLERAQFGMDADRLRIEAHAGGDPTCPTEQSPTPDRTLVIANLPRGAAGTVFTEGDNVKLSYFDFAGDQIPNVPIARATKVTLTVGYSDPQIVEVDFEAEFPEGKILGHASAAFCASLSP